MHHAGIAPCSQKTGGENSPAVNIGLKRKANCRLKNALLQAAHQTGFTSHTAGKIYPKLKEHRLQRHHKELVLRAGKSGLSTARLLLRILRPMVCTESLYLPNKDKSYSEANISEQELVGYIMASFQKMDTNLAPFNLRSIKKNYLTAMKK